MKALSLSTFAEAELMGCGLDDLLNDADDDKAQVFQNWVMLYAFLSERNPEEILGEVLENSDMFAAFVQQVQSSFTEPDGEEAQQSSHRKSKDPRKLVSAPGGDSMKPGGRQPTDYSVLFDLARFAKVPVSDLYKMSFRGLIGLTKHLESNPPQPSMFGE